MCPARTIKQMAARGPLNMTLVRFMQEGDGELGLGISVSPLFGGRTESVAVGEWASDMGSWPPAAWALLIALVAERLAMPPIATVCPSYKFAGPPRTRLRRRPGCSAASPRIYGTSAVFSRGAARRLACRWHAA